MKKIILTLIIGGAIGAGLVKTLQYITFQIPNPVATLPDGAVYAGDMVNGVIEGQGRMIWKNGDRYEGSFKNGLFHGQGLMVGVDGSSYEGQFAEGAITGIGTMVYSDDEQYTGEFQYSRKHGKGILKSFGTEYQGDFFADKYHGKGKFTDEQGNVYAGEFQDGEFHGQGNYVGTDGRKYTGEFVEGIFTGEGSYSDEQGTRYEGGFNDWIYHGKGNLTDEKGDQYIGLFEHGSLNGEGKHIAANGASYAGGFNFGMYEGKGKLTSDNGDIYQGEFGHGQYHGKGTLTYANPKDDTKQLTGTWRYGELIESDDKNHNLSPEINNEIVLYNQQELLEKSWQALEPNDPEKIDLYFLGISGDGSQAVFRREIQFIQDYFDKTFHTQGKSIALINARKTIKEIPLATITSIKRTLQEFAQRMDVENDILFIYMSSHGSKDFEFSLKQTGLALPDLPVQTLADILADLPIRWKIIVVSACYSGGFIPPLENDNTLIITAASAEQKSFGCRDDAEFTYFGEAYFKDALSQTNDFIEAFEIARTIVQEREKAEDYEQSQPQIHKPQAIQQQLQRWAAEEHIRSRGN